MNFSPVLKKSPVHVSVPCRIDFGGTLDISTFFMALKHLKPGTLNLALDMRTRVSLHPWEPGRIKISSRGFDTIERDRYETGTDNPMGLMFAVARFFNAHGVHIDIRSASPPRSALGGSSSAAVAIVSAFYHALEKAPDPEHVTWLAHYLESSVAGVPCGVQDQAAAAFGGVNFWEWGFGDSGPQYVRHPVCETVADIADLNRHILVAYCGIPHESKDVNGRWVKAFKSGRAFKAFEKITGLTRSFTDALKQKAFSAAGEIMNRETRIRCELTPDVLDRTGKVLFEQAGALGCGARFTGAGGGGCLWAVGEAEKIDRLSVSWQETLDRTEDGLILDTSIDTVGIQIHI